MAAQSRGTSPAVSRQLADEPYRFAFFQAVRVLEHLARERLRAGLGPEHLPIGSDNPPQRETVRLRALPAHTFPPAEVVSLKLHESPPSADVAAPLAEMVVSFLGLTGPSGVLPHHYTQLLIDRIRQKDFALRDFLDLFHHRAISLFYRAWEKYRLPAAYERAALDPQAEHEDLFTRSLYCLVGFGTGRLRGRLAIRDAALVYYGGHFAHAPRNAAALESVLVDYFEVPVRVFQFQGRWLALSREDRSRTPSAGAPQGQNCQLGANVVVGHRVWSVENKFRVQLGPLTYEQFRRFLPRGDGLQPLAQLVRCYVGPEFDFDVQPVLQAAEVPPCRAGRDVPVRSQLGWNSWLRSRPMPRDAADAVFQHEGGPA
jgi:type VI secretion system protein ImpH